jgi:hypothetical protein
MGFAQVVRDRVRVSPDPSREPSCEPESNASDPDFLKESPRQQSLESEEKLKRTGQ